MSNRSGDVFEKLKKLKSIEPSSEWVSSCRSDLSNHMRSQGSVSERSFGNSSKMFFREMLSSFSSASPFVRRFTMVTMTAIFMISGGVLGVRASEGSLPGDILYNVKRTKEKVRLNLESSKEAKANLHIEFAGNRLREIDAVQALPLENSKKVVKITAAVADFRNELNEVKNTLNRADDLIKETSKIIQVAQLVEQKTEQYTDYLNKNVKEGVLSVSSVDGSTIKNLDEAIRVGKAVSHEAIVVLVNQKDKEGVGEDKKKEIVDTVIKKIEKTQGDVVSLKEAVMIETGAGDKKTSTPVVPDDASNSIKVDATTENSGTNTVDPLIEVGKQVVDGVVGTQSNLVVVPKTALQPTVTLTDSGKEKVNEVISKEPPKADILLNEAQKLVSEGNLTQALEKVQVTQSLVEEIRGKVDEIVSKESVLPTPTPDPVVEQVAPTDTDNQPTSGSTSDPTSSDLSKDDSSVTPSTGATSSGTNTKIMDPKTTSPVPVQSTSDEKTVTSDSGVKSTVGDSVER